MNKAAGIVQHLICPDWPSLPAHVKALSTTRIGGGSLAPYGDGKGGGGLNLGDHVRDQSDVVCENRSILNALLPRDVIFLSQVHGTIVADARNLSPACCADAVISDVPGVVCAVLTADCLPVLFSDGAGKVVAAAHAGWRGLAAGILQNTVKEMRERGAIEIQAWLGPAIGPDQFEVGQDVFDAFVGVSQNASSCFVQKTSGAQEVKYLADIYQLARYMLSRVGVSSVFGGEYCTVTQDDLFYSYRRDGVTGRMASLIWIDKE